MKQNAKGPFAVRAKIGALVETALLVAAGFVLSYIKFPELPQGGSVTLLSMLPIILIGIRRGPAWGFGGSFVYSLLQALQGGGFVAIHPASFALDYVLPFTVMGLSGFFRKMDKGLAVSVPICLIARLLFHFVSGVILWASYAPEGMNIYLYSLIYNGSYMGIELIGTFTAVLLLARFIPRETLTPVPRDDSGNKPTS